jgi:aminopeptidase N
MEDASGIDLSQFSLWYSQAGTPLLSVSDHYDELSQRYTLSVAQSCPATHGQAEKAPLVIPLAMGLLGTAGNLPLRLAGVEADFESADNTHAVLSVDQVKQSFVFEGVMERPIPSLLRGFSAPVRLHYAYTTDDLCALMRRDADGFVRWDSAQTLATRVIRGVEEHLQAGSELAVDQRMVEACGDLLRDDSLDPAMVAEMLRLPSEDYLAEQASQSGTADVDTIHQARNAVRQVLGEALAPRFRELYDTLHCADAYAPDAQQIAARSLRNLCLSYLVVADSDNLKLARLQYESAGNMTDRLAALREIAYHGDDDLREKTLDHFYQQWSHEVLVVNQWLQLQATIPDNRALERVQSLMSHREFDLHNPNKVRALIGGFANGNPINFHRMDGAGYRFLVDMVIRLNALNPQIASRLLAPLTRWQNYRGRADLMRDQLQRLADEPQLSPDVFEVVTKSLK